MKYTLWMIGFHSFLLLTYSYTQVSLPDDKVISIGDDWYRTTAWTVIHDDMTTTQAREIATTKALTNIIEFYSGIEVNASSFSILTETNLQVGMDHFSQITNTMSRGVILDKKILEKHRKKYGKEWLYIVSLEGKVGKLEGERDKFFKLEAKLNRERYQSGDEMVITIKSTKDCYVYVFNILSDETVNALLPNQYLAENMIRKGETLRVPPKNGIIGNFRVGLPAGEKFAMESILVLGIKAEKDISIKDFDLNMGSYRMALSKLREFIMDFPRDQVEQVNLQYVIENKK